MIICCKLTTAETISLVAAISAAVSAIFSAVAAYLMSRQNFARIKIDITNDITTETPQNIFNNEHGFAFSCITLHNTSSRPITVSECFIKIDKNKFHALRQDMKFEFDIATMELKQSEHAKRILYEDGEDTFARIPIELSAFQSKELFLIFPDFINSNSNIIIGTIYFNYGRSHPKRKKIVLHKLASVG